MRGVFLRSMLMVFSLMDLREPRDWLDLRESWEKSSLLLKLPWLSSSDSPCRCMARSISVIFPPFLKAFPTGFTCC